MEAQVEESYPAYVQEIIDSAVLAERERCAKIAQARADWDCQCNTCGPINEIAAAIRSGK